MKKGLLVWVIALCLALTVPMVMPTQYIAKVEAASSGKLKSKNGKYFYYVKGKKIKKQWKTIKGKQYYFQNDGSAATLSKKIGSKYYVFNKKGQLQTSGKATKKVVKIGNVRYQVNKKGIAVKGWSKDKNYYFDKTGKCYTGIRAINEKFYVFKSTGAKDVEKTKALQKVAKYEKDFGPVKEIIGEPLTSEYMKGCYGDGMDGILEYKNFTVYTYRDTEGNEIFMGVE